MNNRVYTCYYCKKVIALANDSNNNRCYQCGREMIDLRMDSVSWLALTPEVQQSLLKKAYKNEEDWLDLDKEKSDILRSQHGYNSSNLRTTENKSRRLKTTILIMTAIIIALVIIIGVSLVRTGYVKGDQTSLIGYEISSKRVDEKRIQEDMYEVDSFFKKHGMTIDSIEISDRLIDSFGCDRMKLGIYAHNDDFDYHCSYNYILYTKYDEGWKLSDWNKGGYRYWAKNSNKVTQELAESDLTENGYSSLEFIDRQDENNLVTFIFTAVKDEVPYEVTIEYSFKPEHQWDVYHIKVNPVSTSITEPSERIDDLPQIERIFLSNDDRIRNLINKWYNAEVQGDSDVIESLGASLTADDIKSIKAIFPYYDRIEAKEIYVSESSKTGIVRVYPYTEIWYKGANKPFVEIRNYYIDLSSDPYFVPYISVSSEEKEFFDEMEKTSSNWRDLVTRASETTRENINGDEELKNINNEVSDIIYEIYNTQ